MQNFRENVEAGYLPLPTDLTFTGLAKARAGGGRGSMPSRPLLLLACAAWGACQLQAPAVGPIHVSFYPQDYYFDTYGNASTAPCADLFCPIYSASWLAGPREAGACAGRRWNAGPVGRPRGRHAARASAPSAQLVRSPGPPLPLASARRLQVGQSPDPLVGGPDSSELYLAVGLDSGGCWMH